MVMSALIVKRILGKKGSRSFFPEPSSSSKLSFGVWSA